MKKTSAITSHSEVRPNLNIYCDFGCKPGMIDRLFIFRCFLLYTLSLFFLYFGPVESSFLELWVDFASACMQWTLFELSINKTVIFKFKCLGGRYLCAKSIVETLRLSFKFLIRLRCLRCCGYYNLNSKASKSIGAKSNYSIFNIFHS